MMRMLVYCLLGLLALVLQCTLLARVFPLDYKPDLLLLLVVYLGVGEDSLRGAVLAYLFGATQGVFSGIFPGLYGMVLLGTFLLIRSLIGRLNTESSILLLFVVFFATLVEGTFLILLSFFSDAGSLWFIVFERVIPQAFINLASALVILKIISLLQGKPGSSLTVPGLQKLDRRYEP